MIVFFGDSITRDWPIHDVAAREAVNAGIAGQTTGQMRLRFAQDVVGRNPAVVHILGGINDIGENQGPVAVEEVAANLEAMVAEARDAGIGVVIGLLLPCTMFAKRPHLAPRPAIRRLNASIRALGDCQGVAVADYFTPLAGADDRLREGCTADGLHPNLTGYAVMTPVARDALAKLRRLPGASALQGPDGKEIR